jgi:hypothetical protein
MLVTQGGRLSLGRIGKENEWILDLARYFGMELLLLNRMTCGVPDSLQLNVQVTAVKITHSGPL